MVRTDSTTESDRTRKKLKEALLGSPTGKTRDPDGIYLYVKCEKCGATLRVRADKRHDLQRDYDTGEYVLRKEMMDNSCFNLMQATVRFDPSYKIVERQIEGGTFISREDYEAAQPKPESESKESSEDPKAS